MGRFQDGDATMDSIASGAAALGESGSKVRFQEESKGGAAAKRGAAAKGGAAAAKGGASEETKGGAEPAEPEPPKP